MSKAANNAPQAACEIVPESAESTRALGGLRSTADAGGAPKAGAGLILNADDWGRDRINTDRTYDCFQRGTVSAVSAMVFMEDSGRAAELARERGIDAGLHLNFSAPFTAANCQASVAERQSRLTRYLLLHPLARVVYHPGLRNDFEYVIAAQLEEYQRLFGCPPDRIDGHHHLHLCSNVVAAALLPAGTRVRRNFWFQPGEKSFANRYYRQAVDRRLMRRHRVVDFLVNLQPLREERLEEIFSLAQQHLVELECHPVNQEEYVFLTGTFAERATVLPIVSFREAARGVSVGLRSQ